MTDADLESEFQLQVMRFLETRLAGAEEGMLLDPPFSPLTRAEHAAQLERQALWKART